MSQPSQLNATNVSHKLRIFLSYSSKDLNSVRNLYRRLKSEGFEPWLDVIDLLPGQDTRQSTLKAVRESNIVIACLSANSINASGQTHRDIKIALDIAEQLPEGSVYVIPLKLEECSIPESLSSLQAVNYFHKDGYFILLKALRRIYDQNGLTITPAQNPEREVKQKPSPTPTTPTNNIFISYSPEDSKYAYKLWGALEQIGFSVLVDDRVNFGKPWPSEVQENLQKSKALIVIMSSHSYKAKWVEKELEYAKKENKAIFPVWLEGNRWRTFSAEQVEEVTNGLLPKADFFERLAQVVSRNVTPVQPTFSETFRHLRVLRSYLVNAEKEQNIEPGEYAANDPRLYGLADFLVETHCATWINLVGPQLVHITMRYKDQQTKEQYIEPGDYIPNDPRLHGLVDFMLKSDRASWVMVPSVPTGPLKKPSNPLSLPMLDWCDIPAGEVTLRDTHYGRRSFKVEAFKISKYPITNEQYELFQTDAEGYSNDDWWNYSEQAYEWRKKYPQSVTSYFKGSKKARETVAWYEAIAFCRWLSYKSGLSIFLPTEQEWLRAAQGDDEERMFPWGNKFDSAKCNTSESAFGKTTEVDAYPEGVSPFGVYDMSGNVWEWCFNKHASGDTTDACGDEERAEHGGSWHFPQLEARIINRAKYTPYSRDDNVGFRVVCYNRDI